MILAVGNIKSAFGKSTLACNIAVALPFQGGGGVPLINNDKQGSTADFMQSRADLLLAIDAMAARSGMSSNAIISCWCSKGKGSE